MGLAAFNRMRLRRNAAMMPENIKKEEPKKEEKVEEVKEAEVVEEVKKEEPVRKTRKK